MMGEVEGEGKGGSNSPQLGLGKALEMRRVPREVRKREVGKQRTKGLMVYKGLEMGGGSGGTRRKMSEQGGVF